MRAIADGWPGNANALRFVEERANDEPDLTVKEAAFTAIASGWPKEAHAFSFLMKWAKNSNDAPLRLAALNAIGLGWSDTDKGFNFFKERTVSDPEPNLRKAALQHLVGYQYRNATRLLISDNDRDTAIAVLCDRTLHEPEMTVRASIFDLLYFRQ